ncbi:calcium/sodium antiporter [Candidatus Woesearchaeota archaeon]|nr:calcium/sodium antiporter [Candidatus Woesearchaeota archaeon]
MAYFEALLLILGLILLVKGADYFIKSAASIAKKLGISEFIIGLTLVALGTSIPELASSIVASMKNATGIIIGNVVGSNIANIGLIIGVAATIALIKTKKAMLNRDGYIMLFVTGLFYLFMINGIISRIEAGIFLLLYIGYIIFLIEEKPEFEEYHFGHFLRYFLRFQYLITIKSRIFSPKDKKKKEIPPAQKREMKELFKVGLIKDFLIVIIAGSAVVLGAKYLIESAIFFANLFNIPENMIGLSIIAVGTSLPELMVSISAARKGYGNIAIGNIIGSNITNILLIIGVSGLILPISIIKSTLYYTAPFMIFMSLLLLIFIRSYWSIRRIEGTIFLVLYAVFMTILFVNGII